MHQGLKKPLPRAAVLSSVAGFLTHAVTHPDSHLLLVIYCLSTVPPGASSWAQEENERSRKHLKAMQKRKGKFG